MTDQTTPKGPEAKDLEVDLLVVGSGTGMAAALAGKEAGLNVLVVEKTEVVGGSTARSGGAFWIPPNEVLAKEGAEDSEGEVLTYLQSVTGTTSPKERWTAFVENGADTVAMLERTTPLEFFWAKYYSDYHPNQKGGSAEGRSVESKPFDAAKLGEERARLRPGMMEAPVPMPITGADYKWMNLVKASPTKGLPRIVKRAAQGMGGKVLGREYMAGGQALAAGLFAGLIDAGVPVWTRTDLTDLIVEDGKVVGAKLVQDGNEVEVRTRGGVVLATGGFDHNMKWRRKFQAPLVEEDLSLGAEGNTGGGIKAGKNAGAQTALMDQAWWFPGFAPLPGQLPMVMLAERSLPGSFIVNHEGKRFINEAIDYMTFGQTVLNGMRDKTLGEPIWMVFDQKYRNSYIMAGSLFPGMPIPKEWFEAGIAVKGSSPAELAAAMGVPVHQFEESINRFNQLAKLGVDHDFGRGGSAYDRYYGDPTVAPNPNLRPLSGDLYAVKVVVSDLGTCGGLVADDKGRVLNEEGQTIPGLYAIGNTAANVFGESYPGAGATIGQGLVFGYIAARDVAEKLTAQ